MAIISAMTGKFELLEFFGKPVLCSNYHIDENTIPDGYFLYDVRHDDNYPSYYGQLKRSVTVDYICSIITNHEIKLIDNDFLDVKYSDVICIGYSMTMIDYMQKHPRIDSTIQT